ncbi:MAG TPA: phosphotransferase, partial [Thermomicrobiales bacterium]|nr:phosphotransferase [Thermomicrobiales bacterium]
MASVDRRWLYDGADLVTRYLPGYAVERVALIGEGLDNIAFEVNGELIVRRSKVDDSDERAESIRREAGLLALVARSVSLPVPGIAFGDPESGALAYWKLPGVPLSRLDMPVTDPFGPALGRFLSDLHRM